MPRLIVVSAPGFELQDLLLAAEKELQGAGYMLARRYEETSWSEIFAVAGSGGLLGGRSLFVVENASRLGPFPEVFLPWLEGETAEAAVVLAYEGDHRKHLSKEVLKRAHLYELQAVPRWGKARLDWIAAQAKNLGVRLDGEAISLLSEYFEEPKELKSELEKLAVASEDGKISVALVRELSVSSGGRKLVKFLDALCEGKIPEALEAMVNLKEETDVLPVITGLHRRFRLAAYTSCLPPGAHEAFLEALKARGYQARMAKAAAKRYPKAAIWRFLTGIIGLSYREKVGEGSGWVQLEELAIELLGSRAS